MAALQQAAYAGLPGGMNLSRPAYELDDTECRYLQDALLDYQGLIRRRGPVTSVSGFATIPDKAVGLLSTLDPQGIFKVAVLTGDNGSSVGFLRALSNDYASITGTFAYPIPLYSRPPNFPYRHVDVKPALNGGALYGIASKNGLITAPAAVDNATLAFWHGANLPLYSTGTASITQGSKTVTGSGTSWNSNASPGMYLFVTVDNAQPTGGLFKGYIGTVKSVDSDTQLTLQAASPYTTSAAAYDLQMTRGWNYKIAKGRITTTTSTTTVTGAQTKFISQFMDEVLSVQTGNTTSASAVITGLTSTDGLLRGMRITGTNIPANSLINSIDSSTQITISQNATGTGSVSLTFKDGWNLYRASDMGWVGRVTTVNNEISITLAANASLALNNERFVALKNRFGKYNSTSPDMGILGDHPNFSGVSRHKVGYLHATYAGRQWYANNQTSLETLSRVWFSEPADPEAVDLSEYDGDFVPAYSSVETDTPIKAIVPAYNGLGVIKENEAYVITGSSPSTFSLKKIYDDGTLSGMSVVPYAGGIIWAGREGILFYDGVETTNITRNRLGDYYKQAITDLNVNTHRLWATMMREHYVLFMESFSPTVAVIKGSVSQTPTQIALVINMVTGAVTIWTNLNLRGATETPADTGKKLLYIVNGEVGPNQIANPSFEVDTSGWSNEGEGSTIARDTTTFKFGAASVRADTAAAIGHGLAMNNASPPGPPAVQGETWTVSVWVNAPNTQAMQLQLTERSSLGVGLATATENFNGTGDWQLVTHTRTLTEATTAYITIKVVINSSTAVTFYVDGVVIEKAATWADFHHGTIADGDSLFDLTGVDSFACDEATAGPDFYLESKKYTMGNPMIKKLFKQLSLNYMVLGDSLKLDTILGVQNIGRTAKSSFPSTGYTWNDLSTLFLSWDDLANTFPTWDTLIAANFKPRRIKFLKRSQMLAFRLYQNSNAITQLELGPFQIAYKWQRIGRI